MEQLAGEEQVFTVGHFYVGKGGMARGAQLARPEWRGIKGRFVNVAGVDVNPVRCAQCTRLTGTPAYVLDMFSREDYIAFHGKEPPPDWREASPEDIIRIFGPQAPDVITITAPCKGFSALLPKDKARQGKYLALNNLVERAIFLCLVTWPDDPPGIFIFENVPMIKHRGKGKLKYIRRLLESHGYAVREEDHNLGEVGGLGQNRWRFKLVARHVGKVSPYVYKPPKRRLRSIGEVIGEIPWRPGDPDGGPLNAIPKVSFLTWLRLASIRPGGDWKDIPAPGEWRLMTLDGREVPGDAFDDKRSPDSAKWGRIFVLELLPGAKHYQDIRLRHNPMGNGRGAWWVQNPGDSSGTVTGDPGYRKSGGASAVADGHLNLRCPDKPNRHKSHYRVSGQDEAGGVVTGADHLANGAPSMADLRLSLRDNRHASKFNTNDHNQPGDTVTGSDRIGSGAPSTADLRLTYQPRDKDHSVADSAKPSPAVPGNASVTKSNGPGAVADTDLRLTRQPKGGTCGVNDPAAAARTVTPHPDVNGDAQSLADIRMRCKPQNGTVGVVAWDGPSPTVIASLDVYAGPAAVEDRQVTIHNWPAGFPDYIIISPWNAWHRPMTDLELAVLQGWPAVMEDGTPFFLEGSRKDRRDAIGNAMPPPAAEAILESVGITLIVSRVEPGAWMMSPYGTPVWVREQEQLQAD